MAVQAGKDLLVKVDMTSDGQFETIAGLRATRISFNAEPVDVTTLDSSGGWRELLAGAGVRSASISGSGVFRDAGTDERTRQLFFDGLTPDFQIVTEPSTSGSLFGMMCRSLWQPLPLGWGSTSRTYVL